MATHYEVRYASGPAAVRDYDTTQLRDEFLVRGILQAGSVRWVYSHYDRYLMGGAVPTDGPLDLATIDPLKADYFLERRELGAINVGGPGSITVDGQRYPLQYKEALYVGRGSREVTFASDDASKPARFYLNSAPAHREYPTTLVTREQANVLQLGDASTANARTVRQLIVGKIVKSCQLQMGMTELKTGSVWNTMPAHVHDRRMEMYFYFEVPDDQAVCHFMGPTDETRHLWLHNEDGVISPPWSIHSGAGTSNYCFIWGMAGENLDYDDMDKCAVRDLR